MKLKWGNFEILGQDSYFLDYWLTFFVYQYFIQRYRNKESILFGVNIYFIRPPDVFLTSAIYATLIEVYRIERVRLKKEIFYQHFGHAISDAVRNAIYHGNRNDPEKRVFVACWYCENGVIVAVADEGNFYSRQKTKTLVESRTILRSTKEKPSGAGMDCIYEGADKIYVDTKQNTLFIAIALDKILVDKKGEPVIQEVRILP